MTASRDDRFLNPLPIPMATQSLLSDDELNEEIAQILVAADRLRLVALDRTRALAEAKTKSLQRELRIVQALSPDDTTAVLEATRRVEAQQRFESLAVAEIQRGEVEAPTRNPVGLILFGRVVDGNRLGKEGLVVSATGSDGRAAVFGGTDANGNFRLDVPASRLSDSSTAQQAVTLLVSDSQQAILYRGTEIFSVEGGKVIYREIVLGDEPGRPTPQPPPPVSEQVVVPNVVGAERSSAIAVLKRSGLLTEEKAEQVEDGKVGLVVAQDPKAGTSAVAGSLVTISVGIATESVAVPDVVGSIFGEASVSLKKVQLLVGSVEPANPGANALVLAQSPKAGSKLARGSFVDLKVQPSMTPPSTVEVPDLTGLTLDDARQKLSAQKLKPGSLTLQLTSDGQAGLVLSQNPKAGAKVAPGSQVALVVSAKQGTPSAPTATQTIKHAGPRPRRPRKSRGK
jgi:beta-lactam-binding protein with PASTA domain